jgi:ABC-type bacteriocin/lantibiotic exporter with double-glycine peptidase domain
MLSRLLVGLLVPQEGSITFDGNDSRELDLSALRRHVGVVTQTVEVLSGSIRANIAITEPGATAEQIERTACLAHVHEDIMRMPMGYDTVLGERGMGLSGGQRQRLALARALVNRPRILVLDEATSHLDARTEQEVFDDLRTLECTQIVIAHRLSTIRDVDAIHVIEDGHLVDSGTHGELLYACPLYGSLVAGQLGEQPLNLEALGARSSSSASGIGGMA